LKLRLIFLFLFSAPVTLFSQVVYQDLGNTNIYEFLDELSNLGIISLHSHVKPWPVQMIAGKLKEASEKQEQLTPRQRKELAFYLRDFNLWLQPDLGYIKTGKGLFRNKRNMGIPLNPLAFLYKDSLLTFSAKPVWGICYTINSGEPFYHRWGGFEVSGAIGKHFGFYASLRDNHENLINVNPEYFTQDEGAVWKVLEKGGDYSEMRGGLTFSWNWGSVALTKDHFVWGGNYHGSNIFSGRTPSFPYFELRMNHVPWFNYTFLTGWLNSGVIDSSRSHSIPGGTRSFYFNKFLSASLFTFTPWKGFDASVGNSMISCSESYNPAFLSPFLFFVNFSYSGDSLQKEYYGNNSQLFLTINSRQVKHMNIYASLFIDDLGSRRNKEHNAYNSISGKAGIRVSDFPLKNISFTGEYTRSSPNSYLCDVATLTFASNGYNLGHYLSDNSQEFYVAVAYKPVRGLHFRLDYAFAEHGDDRISGTLGKILWKNHTATAGVKYEIINNAYVFVEYMYSKTFGDVSFTPPVLRFHEASMIAGFNIGF
jgi:hypothetical protein